ncbi:MAG TPA: DUF4349 domain-containing protein [Candidatus Woesebacteria bacterium]|nr:DUF4349 domain-containing protein [Candidatus Woesebacteria bacterium]HNS65044.1 DUF4349 domain-containing protein [Candidatus Woesebacteria bacterium]
MKKQYLWAIVVILVLAGATLFVTRSQDLRMPVTMPEFVNTQSTSNDSFAIGAEPAGYMEKGVMVSDVYQPMPPYIGGGDALTVEERQYQTYASFSVVVKDVSGYLNQLREKYLGMEGRVLNLSTNTSGKYQNGYLTAKVPVASFDSASQEATKGVEKIVDQSVNSTDVTGVAVSFEEQIQQLETQRSQREVDLLEAKTDAEKKRIQLDINRLQNQIESLKKQKVNQQTQVQYATITVSAASSEKVFNPSTRPDLGETLREAVDSVLNNLFEVAQFFIWAAVYAVVLLPALWLIGKLRKPKTTVTTE